MKLIRYQQPNIHTLSDFDRVFERAFSNFADLFGAYEPLSNPATIPVNLYESDNAYLARYELPGFDKKEIQVELADEQLVVTAKREEGEGEDKRSYQLKRAIQAPKGIRAKGIKARLENGILNIELPKAEERKPQAISVK